MFKVKASRVDKLQVELNSQRERLEEANRTTAKLKVSSSSNHTPYASLTVYTPVVTFCAFV